MTIKKLHFGLLFLSCILISPESTAQDPFPEFRITRFGNSIEEPFHSGSRFRQDAHGRLIMDHFSYDGHRFFRNGIRDTLGKFLGLDEKGGQWYTKEDLKINHVFDEQTITFDLSPFAKYEIGQIHFHNEEIYLVNHAEIVQIEKKKNELVHVRTIPVIGNELVRMHKIQDTLYLKSLRHSSYILNTDLSNEVIYQRADYSNFSNDIFYLPNSNIMLAKTKEAKVLSKSHPHHQALSKLGDNSITAHLLDHKGRLWIAYRGKKEKGIFLAQPNAKHFQHIELGIENTSFIQDIFQDSQNNVWVGTGGQGIVQLHEPQIHVLDKTAGLSSNNIWSISQNEAGEIYFSSSCSGVDVLSYNGAQKHILETNCQKALFHDSKGNFWVALDGITKIDKAGEKTNYQKQEGLISRTVTTIMEDSGGTIWLGTRKGIHRQDGEIFVPYVAPGVQEFDRVLAMREYENGKFILAFGSGKIFTFDGSIFNEVDFENRKVNTIFKDFENRIWIASQSDGLFLFNNGDIQQVPFREAKPRSVRMLQDDRHGKMWGICEGNRLFSFDKASYLIKGNDHELKYYSTADGVPLIASNNDIQPTTKLLQDGRIIFPNIYGAILVDPKQKLQTQKSFHTEVLMDNKVIESPIQLNKGQTNVTLQLKPIVLASNQSIRFQYKIDEQWIDVEENGTLLITNLQTGDNTLMLRGGVVDNYYQKIPSIRIYIPPLLYQQPLFWLLAMAGISFLIFSIVRWRTKLIKARNQELQEKVAAQTAELENEKQQLSKSLDAQKKLTHELNLTHEAKNRMYAQISHEFKSPLQVIKANLTSVQGQIITENQKRITANINNLLSISNEIMDLSRAESGKLKAKKNWYNINGIIKEQIELIRPLADKKGIKFSFDLGSKYFLYMDISLMQKVISNLLSNAIKFSSKDSEIQIDSKKDGKHQLIQITDSGIGINDQEIPKLTLPYYQAENNLEGGTGIGLSLVEQILKLHDSQLEITSQLGKGSTFAFRLLKPAISQEEILSSYLQQPNIDTQLKQIAHIEKPIILAVDDSADVLHFINQTLSDTYHVVQASNAEIALDLLNKIEPDVIISDVNMPIMNGMDFLIAVRNIHKYKAIPFLFLTGSLSEDTELRSIRAGADFVLQKPIQEEYLISRIKQMLQRQEVLEEKVKSSFNHQLIPQNIHNDDLFLMNQLETVILENLKNNKLTSADIANMLGMGEKTLRNRVKKIAGLTLKKYLRCIRLEKAKLLIEEEYGNLSEVAAATGFSSLSYFSKAYKAYFGGKEL